SRARCVSCFTSTSVRCATVGTCRCGSLDFAMSFGNVAETRVTEGSELRRRRLRRSSLVVRIACACLLLTLVREASAQDDPWSSDPAVESDVRELLGDPQRFRYCHEEGYRLWPHEKITYCDRADALSERCPGLRRACELPAYGTAQASEE